jgi:DNA helicase HerA-like ATPase
MYAVPDSVLVSGRDKNALEASLDDKQMVRRWLRRYRLFSLTYTFVIHRRADLRHRLRVEP